MEALVQTQDNFIFRQPSIPVRDPRNDLVQNDTSTILFNHSKSEDYPVSVPNHVVREGNTSPEGCYQEGEISDATLLKYISQMLMEEDDLEYKPCMFRDCMALQAAEKYFSNVLDGSESKENNVIMDSSSSHLISSTTSSSSDSIESPQWDLHFESLVSVSQSHLRSLSGDVSSGLLLDHRHGDSLLNSLQYSFGNDHFDQEEEEAGNLFHSSSSHSPSGWREKKNRHREDNYDAAEQQRSNKHLAAFAESEPLEMYDKVLLCSNNPYVEHNTTTTITTTSPNEAKNTTKGRPRGGRKHGSNKDMVDLRSLLTQCAQALANYDSRTANELLMRIREHSSPHGDGTERLAHYLANALEARLSGLTGTAAFYTSSRKSAAQILKSYKMFIKACPFKLMSNVFANKYIQKVVARGEAPRIHIIDFGILYGFQWPCLIQGLSLRPGGPPNLRITGIDLPQPGFRPAERVEDTGRRLEKY